MTKKQEEALRQEFKKGFEEQFKNGMTQGAYAICKVIHDKATNDSISVEERLAEIVRFCEVSLNVNQPKDK